LKQTLASIDNDTLRVEQAQLGPLESLDAGTLGTEYFDAFESRRSIYIGPAGGTGLGGRLYAPAYAPERRPTLIARLLDQLKRAVEKARTERVLTTPPTGQTWKVYYFAGTQRVAMRVLTGANDTLYYLHADHLGSTSLTTCGNTGGCGAIPLGGVVARQSYYPYGALRPGGTGTMPTDRGFTGQYADDTGLYFYNARYYSSIGRFISADTIVPEPENPPVRRSGRCVNGYATPANRGRGQANTCGAVLPSSNRDRLFVALLNQRSD
jgi:RHS repeat-associated protein